MLRFKFIYNAVNPMLLLGELTALPQTSYMHLGRGFWMGRGEKVEGKGKKSEWGRKG